MESMEDQRLKAILSLVSSCGIMRCIIRSCSGTTMMKLEKSYLSGDKGNRFHVVKLVIKSRKKRFMILG